MLTTDATRAIIIFHWTQYVNVSNASIALYVHSPLLQEIC